MTEDEPAEAVGAPAETPKRPWSEPLLEVIPATETDAGLLSHLDALTGHS